MNRDEPIVRPGAGAQHVSWFNLEYQLILIIFNVLDDLTVILFTILLISYKWFWTFFEIEKITHDDTIRKIIFNVRPILFSSHESASEWFKKKRGNGIP